MGRPTKWTKKKLARVALKYNSKVDMRKANGGAYYAMYKQGLTDELCTHMTGNKKKWCLNTSKVEALKYTNRSDFMRNSGSCHQYCMREEILDEVCSHMTVKRVKWTREKLRKEALKYNTISEFAQGSGAAYLYAARHGMIDEVCQHMVRSCKRSNVIYIWKVIGEVWNDKNVYKIGVTVDYMGLTRLRAVANYHGFEMEVVLYKIVDNPIKVEKELLERFEPVPIKGKGGTEFRAINDYELSTLLV